MPAIAAATDYRKQAGLLDAGGALDQVGQAVAELGAVGVADTDAQWLDDRDLVDVGSHAGERVVEVRGGSVIGETAGSEAEDGRRFRHGDRGAEASATTGELRYADDEDAVDNYGGRLGGGDATAGVAAPVVGVARGRYVERHSQRDGATVGQCDIHGHGPPRDAGGVDHRRVGRPGVESGHACPVDRASERHQGGSLAPSMVFQWSRCRSLGPSRT